MPNFITSSKGLVEDRKTPINMFAVLCLIAAVLPWTIVEGKKGCWADPFRPADECLYGTEIPGGRDLGIQYYFTSRFSRICCEALECDYRKPNCEFKFVGCGQSIGSKYQTDILRWNFKNVEPIMRCTDIIGNGAFYTYTVSIVPRD